MKDTLAVVCLLIAIVLVVADVVLAFAALKSRKDEQEAQGQGGPRTVFPGEKVVEALADKAPRLAAAFAFMVLAGIFSGVLHFEANASSEDAGEESSSQSVVPD